MTTSAIPCDHDGDGPGFDRRRLDPERVPRVLELTTSLCAVNDALAVRLRPTRVDRRSASARPSAPEELVDRRRLLLDELHRLIAS
jgi:hypothetical protein